jgi:hypothetical protein
MPRVPAIALAAAATLLVFLFLWLNYALPVRWGLNIEQAGGNVGGIFGFSSALFTGLAFVGLVYAVKLQRDELQIARDSLESAKAELKVAGANQKTFNDQIELQNRESQKKSFEDTFFRMLAELDSIYEGIAINERYRHSRDGNHVIEPLGEVRGHAALAIMQKELMQIINMPFSDRDIEELYDYFYQFRRNDIGQYFRWIYYTLYFIHKNSNVDRLFYAKLLRARLSDGEIALIAYNGIGQFGERLMSLIEEYAFLNNIDEDDEAIRVDILRDIYKDSAFQSHEL